MSNLSLKEQLRALVPSGSSSRTSSDKHKKTSRPRNTPPEKAKQKPDWLQLAQYGVELLKAWFPNCFRESQEIRPLKVGIKQDLVKHLGTRTDIAIADKACMVKSLAYYVNTAAYHRMMFEGAMRIDLDGNDAGLVTAEEAQYSAECRQAKLQKKQSGTPVSSPQSGAHG